MSRFTLYKWFHRPPSITVIRHWLAFSCSLTYCFRNRSMRPPHFICELKCHELHSENLCQFTAAEKKKGRIRIKSILVSVENDDVAESSVQTRLFSGYCSHQVGSVVGIFQVAIVFFQAVTCTDVLSRFSFTIQKALNIVQSNLQIWSSAGKIWWTWGGNGWRELMRAGPPRLVVTQMLLDASTTFLMLLWQTMLS